MPSVALGSAFVMSLLIGSRASSSIQADLRVVGKGPTPGEHFPAWASGYLRLCPQAAARGLSLRRSRLHFGGQCPCCADVLVVEHPEVRWAGCTHGRVCVHTCVSACSSFLGWLCPVSSSQ